MERWLDLWIYGIFVLKDGKRIDPMDIYITPPERA